MKHPIPVFMILSCLGCVAMAAETPDQQAEAWLNHFKKADANSSGGLSKAELDKTKPNEFAPIKRFFAKMDSNKDGQVTPKEYAEFTQKRRAAWVATFNAADLNGSKGLSRAELDKTKPNQFSGIKKYFDAMDTNKDGQVSLEERDNFHPNASKKASAMESKPPQSGNGTAPAASSGTEDDSEDTGVLPFLNRLLK